MLKNTTSQPISHAQARQLRWRQEQPSRRRCEKSIEEQVVTDLCGYYGEVKGLRGLTLDGLSCCTDVQCSQRHHSFAEVSTPTAPDGPNPRSTSARCCCFRLRLHPHPPTAAHSPSHPAWTEKHCLLGIRTDSRR